MDSSSRLAISMEHHSPFVDGTPKSLRFTRWRWTVLFLMNFILLGNFYCYDNPQALETHLIEELKITRTQYNLLYSIISFPNIIFPFIGGYITDYFGVRKGLLFFQTLVTLGQAIFAYGAYTSSYFWMLTGRLIYGLGTDTQSVAENSLASYWFEGKEQAFAIALCTTMFGIGSTMDTFVTPRLQEYSQNLYLPALFGVILCIFSQLLLFVLLWIDLKNERQEKAFEKFTTGVSLKQSFSEGHKIRLKDIKNFKRIFWFLAVNYGLAGSIFFTFTNLANDFVSQRFGFDNIEAGDIVASIYIAMAIAAPACGLLVDKYGRRVKVLVLACLLGIAIYTFLAFMPVCNKCYTIIFPLIGLGIFLGAYDSGIMPSLPLILDKEYYATGFGLYFVAQNITMTIIPIIVGRIQDVTIDVDFGYFWVLIFMIGYSLVTLVSCVPIFYEDAKLNHILNNYKIGYKKDFLK